MSINYPLRSLLQQVSLQQCQKYLVYPNIVRICDKYWKYSLYANNDDNGDDSLIFIWKEPQICIHISSLMKDCISSLLPIYIQSQSRLTRNILMMLGPSEFSDILWISHPKILNIEYYRFLIANSHEKYDNMSWSNTFTTDIKFIIPSYLSIIVDEDGNKAVSNTFKAWFMWLSMLNKLRKTYNQSLTNYYCANLGQDKRINASIKHKIYILMDKLDYFVNSIFCRLSIPYHQLFYLCNVDFELFEHLVRDICGIQYSVIYIKSNILFKWEAMVRCILMNIFQCIDIVNVILKCVIWQYHDMQICENIYFR